MTDTKVPVTFKSLYIFHYQRLTKYICSASLCMKALDIKALNNVNVNLVSSNYFLIAFCTMFCDPKRGPP